MSSEPTIEVMNPMIDDYWEPEMPPTDLIFDDGEPLETNRHRIAMNVLIRSLQHAWSDRTDFFTGGNMFIYYSRSQAKNRDFRGPDFFTVLDIDGSYPRQGWVVWDEEGRYPDTIVELLSSSTAEADKGAKKRIYERVFKTPDYFVYDPFDASSLQGWRLDAQFKYQPLTPNEGWLWCESLGLWLGTWEGTIERESAIWLRFYDRDRNLILLPEEAERQRANDAESRAEQEQQRVEQERQRAEQERQRAEQERQRAEQAESRAEQERQEKERLLDRLNTMGINLDDLIE